MRLTRNALLLAVIVAAVAVGGSAFAGSTRAPKPSISVVARSDGPEKEVGVEVTVPKSPAPKWDSARVNVFFDRESDAYDAPILDVSILIGPLPDLGFVTFMDDNPGPVTGPTERLIDAVCNRSHGLC